MEIMSDSEVAREGPKQQSLFRKRSFMTVTTLFSTVLNCHYSICGTSVTEPDHSCTCTSAR